MTTLPQGRCQFGAMRQELRLQATHPTLREAWTRGIALQAARARGDVPAAAMPDALRRKAFLEQLRPAARLTNDWFTDNAEQIHEGLEDSGQTFTRFLEVGSFEGLSTVWFGQYLAGRTPRPLITVIDRFQIHAEHGDYEARFDHNIRTFLPHVPVEKVKSASNLGLSELLREQRVFDLIYVDGSHEAYDVLVDACLGWKLLRPGGVILFDDYYWVHDSIPKRTLEGLNVFLSLAEGEFRVLKVYWQVMLQKIDAPTPPADPRA